MARQRSNSKLKSNFSETVAQSLESAILSGEFRVNERLPTEVQLCEQYNVSRTVIREAVQNLKARGLLRSVVGSGSFVQPYDFDQVNQAIQRFGCMNEGREVFLSLLDLRMILETEIAERAAHGASISSQTKLRDSVERMERMSTAPELCAEKFADEDRNFHGVLADASGNPLFGSILEALSRTIDNPLRDEAAQPVKDKEREAALREVMRSVHDDHLQILMAVERRDPSTAGHAMKTHIDHARQVFLKHSVRGPAN